MKELLIKTFPGELYFIIRLVIIVRVSIFIKSRFLMISFSMKRNIIIQKDYEQTFKMTHFQLIWEYLYEYYPSSGDILCTIFFSNGLKLQVEKLCWIYKGHYLA